MHDVHDIMLTAQLLTLASNVKIRGCCVPIDLRIHIIDHLSIFEVTLPDMKILARWMTNDKGQGEIGAE